MGRPCLIPVGWSGAPGELDHKYTCSNNAVLGKQGPERHLDEHSTFHGPSGVSRGGSSRRDASCSLELQSHQKVSQRTVPPDRGAVWLDCIMSELPR